MIQGWFMNSVMVIRWVGSVFSKFRISCLTEKSSINSVSHNMKFHLKTRNSLQDKNENLEKWEITYMRVGWGGYGSTVKQNVFWHIWVGGVNEQTDEWILLQIFYNQMSDSIRKKSLFFRTGQLFPTCLPSSDTSDHSGFGNSYWPIRIRFFMPGEMARPWLE